MGLKRPYKVRFHYDGTKVGPGIDTSVDPGAYTIDHTQPIDATHSFAHEGDALTTAEGVSRRGGRAEVFYRDPTTGVDTPIRTLEPYEIAMDELTAESEY